MIIRTTGVSPLFFWQNVRVCACCVDLTTVYLQKYLSPKHFLKMFILSFLSSLFAQKKTQQFNVEFTYSNVTVHAMPPTIHSFVVDSSFLFNNTIEYGI